MRMFRYTMATRERKGMLKITETQEKLGGAQTKLTSNNRTCVHSGTLPAHLSACEPIHKCKSKLQTVLLSVITGYLFEVSNIC